MPDYSNHFTRMTEERLGPFQFNENDTPRNDLIARKPFELDNEAVYFGQWTKEAKREGSWCWWIWLGVRGRRTRRVTTGRDAWKERRSTRGTSFHMQFVGTKGVY